MTQPLSLNHRSLKRVGAAPRQTSILIATIANSVLLAGCGERTSQPPNVVTETIEHKTIEAEKPTTDVESDPVLSGSDSVETHPATVSSNDESTIASSSMNEQQTDSTASADRPSIDPRWRRNDDRPDINELRLQQAGIRIIESKRLRLLTDLPKGNIDSIPALADRLFDKLEQFFGKLPSAMDGSDYQVTGHVIGNEENFQQAGLMPRESFTFQHGRHLHYQFWMNAQNDDYYQRHLLLHEFVHCFMTCESGMLDIPPLWYIEGMAEYFATHTISADGKSDFAIMPYNYDDFAGWGRIFAMQQFSQNQQDFPGVPTYAATMPAVVSGAVDDMDYAWWWAVCWMLHRHPVYSRDLEELTKARSRVAFLTAYDDLFATHGQRLQEDWLLFIESLTEGFDPKRSFPVRHPADNTSIVGDSESEAVVHIEADHDWQSSGIIVSAGEQVSFTCEGRYQVANDPTPWISEPQGITIEYYRGNPLGQIIAVIVSNDATVITRRIPIGRKAKVDAPVTGRIWLQINDSPARRSDNSGTATIHITR